MKSFLEDFWNYYHQLLEFKESPTEAFAQELRDRFDELFSIQTGYDELDQRISKMLSKAEELLQVLLHPQIPLHNNSTELGARSAVSRRDISLHTMTPEGTKANDSFMTLIETAKKQGISAFHYLYDRISGNLQMPSLAQTIEENTRAVSTNQMQTVASFYVGIKKLSFQAVIDMEQKVEGFFPTLTSSHNTS